MSKDLEIEFKTLLTKDEYVSLCERFKESKRNLQINYYFDTTRFTLKASDISLRVRMIDKDKYVINLKKKKGYALQEVTETIDKATFDVFLETGTVPIDNIRSEIADIIKEQKLVNYMTLSTYRIFVPYKKGQLAIDKCKYVDTVDYELEYKASSYEAGKREFVEIVREFNIIYKKGQTKIKRAYDALRKKI